MTLPLAVFLKNFFWVTTASARGRLRMVISTMVEVRMRHVLGKFRSPLPIGNPLLAQESKGTADIKFLRRAQET